jgi:ubiquinone/menaquinone biosynthesis C-methylase UbiE
MSKQLCPYWVGFWLANPLRRFFQDPVKILSPYVKTGMTVLDIGPAMGFFSLPLAKMVGPDGNVVCVDVQDKMLRSLERRAKAAQLADRIIARHCKPYSLCIDEFAGMIDFVLAFAVVHEIPDVSNFFAEIYKTLKPGAVCLVAEPRGHVNVGEFAETLSLAGKNGLIKTGEPAITWRMDTS